MRWRIKKGLVYTARIKLKQRFIMIDGRRVLLSPGLAVEAEIKTGRDG